MKSKSVTGSNQPEATPISMVIPLPAPGEQTPPLASDKCKGKHKANKNLKAAPDSPAMGTRSKRKLLD